MKRIKKGLTGILAGVLLSSVSASEAQLRTGYVAHLEKNYVVQMCKKNDELKNLYGKNLEECVQDVNEVFNGRSQVVKRLIEFNAETGYLGENLPRPSSFTRLDTTEENKLRIAAKVARDMTPEILSYFLATMNEVNGYEKIKDNLRKAIKYDVIGLLILSGIGNTIIGGGTSVSHDAPIDIIKGPGVR